MSEVLFGLDLVIRCNTYKNRPITHNRFFSKYQSLINFLVVSLSNEHDYSVPLFYGPSTLLPARIPVRCAY